jgi:hypothetical protein
MQDPPGYRRCREGTPPCLPSYHLLFTAYSLGVKLYGSLFLYTGVFSRFAKDRDLFSYSQNCRMTVKSQDDRDFWDNVDRVGISTTII